MDTGTVKQSMESHSLIRAFSEERNWEVGSSAMLLALTRSMKAEEEVKRILNKEGFKYVVTEIGGRSFVEFQEKTTKAVLGACLNCGLIKKTAYHAHAVLHAAEEAKKGILVNVSGSTSLAVKIAIVRDNNWVAVAMFGQSAIHPLTNHERAGLGVMHISSDDENSK